jgi:hypothetical protein
MRVTIQLDDDLHRKSKEEARRRGVTLSQFAESGLRKLLAKWARERRSAKRAETVRAKS